MMAKNMNRKLPPLIETNPYLQDPAECDVWLTRSVVSSSAIEGVHMAARRALGVAGNLKATESRAVSSESDQSDR
jgi:hypothetical protein